MTATGRVFLGDADGDGGTLQRHLPCSPRSSPPVGGEATQAGNVAGYDGTADCQPPRYGRHRHDALGTTRRTDNAPAAGDSRLHSRRKPLGICLTVS